MDTQTTPLEAGLMWTVAMHKPDFIGKPALLRQQEQGLTRRFVGFELSQGPMPRLGAELLVEGRRVGMVTSGTFSPVLGRPLGMGYVEPPFAAVGTSLTLTVRSQRYPATVVKLPFWKGETTQPALASGAAKPLEKLT